MADVRLNQEGDKELALNPGQGRLLVGLSKMAQQIETAAVWRQERQVAHDKPCQHVAAAANHMKDARPHFGTVGSSG